VNEPGGQQAGKPGAEKLGEPDARQLRKPGVLLAGDVGGTHTRLGLYTADAGPSRPLAEASFPSRDYASLESLARRFLADHPRPVRRASFGVAGPVVSGRVATTNLPWVIEAERVARALDVECVDLMNDLVAVALAVPELEPHELRTLNEGEPVRDGAIAVVAPGTGLGAAYLTHDGTGYHAYASEGGHSDFGPGDDLQTDLHRFIRRKFGHASWERVVSGSGIPNIYDCLRESGRADEPAWLARKLAEAVDRAPIILEQALAGGPGADLCVQTMEVFVSALGSYAGNSALQLLSTGGVYLGGGIPPRILPLLAGPGFMNAFRHKGRMGPLMQRIPVHVILDTRIGVRGAASYGLAAGG